VLWVLWVCVACVARPQHVMLQAEHAELQARVDAVEVRATEQEHDLIAAQDRALRSGQESERVTGLLVQRDQQNQQLSDTIEGLEEEQEGADAWANSLREHLRGMVEVGSLSVSQWGDRLIVELPNDVLFPPGSARIASEGRTTLASIASALASLEGREILVSGHTDATPIHNEEFDDNWSLGAARAISVVQILIEEGVPPDRVGAASYGSNRPLDSNKTPEGRRANRRIEITILPDLAVIEEVQGEVEGR
jgi:chemotaxis protein MotB